MRSATGHDAAATARYDDRIRVVGPRRTIVTLHIPKKALTVVTGVSGSGKSSPVLDTIAAEAQRLMIDSFP